VKLFLSTDVCSSSNYIIGTLFLYSLFRFVASACFILRLSKYGHSMAAGCLFYRHFIFLEDEQAVFLIIVSLVTHSLNQSRWPGGEYSDGLDQGQMPTPGLEGRGHSYPDTWTKRDFSGMKKSSFWKDAGKISVCLVALYTVKLHIAVVFKPNIYVNFLCFFSVFQ